MRASSSSIWRHDFREDEPVCRGQVIRLQGLEQLLPAGLESPGRLEDLGYRLIGDERLDHRATGLAVQVRDEDIQPKARIGQYLVQPILLRGQQATEFLPLSG